MHTFKPGQSAVISQDGLPSGLVLGFQIQKTASGTVVQARTTTGVVERPAGTGNYVFPFVAPAESDLYLFIIDWNGGVLTAEESLVLDLSISSTAEAEETGLGSIADFAKMHLGGETWALLSGSSKYGPGSIVTAVTVVKSRIFTNPPDAVVESALPIPVLNYAGLCVALELIPAAKDVYGSSYISVSTGDDPTERVTYPNRVEMMKTIEESLRAKLADAMTQALPLIIDPVVAWSSLGPGIDEETDDRVTLDPRDFPVEETLVADAFGVPTGVSL